MEVTFGAVGDFISIGVLIKDFIELLDDSRGSAWEYNSLKQQLIFLRLNLDLAKRSYDEYYSAPQFQHFRNALESVVDEAERRLEGIAVKVQKYTSTLSKGSTERKIKKVARKVQWSLEKKETEKFLLDLHRYTSILQSLQFNAFARLMERNFTCSQKDQNDTQELVSKLQQNFEDRFTSLEDELRAARAMSVNTQQYLVDIGTIVTRRLDTITQTVNSLGIVFIRGLSGMSYFGTSVLSLLSAMHTNIIGRLERPPHMGPFFSFEDYLGVDSIILLHFVDSWNAFEGSLHGKFKGRKGGRRVARNRFLLQDHQTGDEIDRDAHWSLAITPGSRINMSLICEVEENEDEAQSLKCPFPSCGAMCEGVIGTVIQCLSCQQLFRKLPGMSDDEELPTAPNAPDSGINDPNLKPGSNSPEICHSNINGGHRDKRAALRAKRKPADASKTGSDSDDADLIGIKRVTVLPILRLAIRPTPSDSETDRKVGPSTQQIAFAEQRKGHGLGHVPESESVETPWVTIKSLAEHKNRRVSRLQSGSYEGQVGSGTAYMSDTTYQTSGGYYEYQYDKIPGEGKHVFESAIPGGPKPNDPRLKYATTRVSRRPSKPRNTRSEGNKKPVERDMRKVRKATEADAKRYRIPAGYHLKRWDPDEKPIMLLGSVFDGNSFGKWVYDWCLHIHGPSAPMTDTAGKLWLLLIQLTSRVKRAEEKVELIQSKDSKDLVEEYIEAGERFWARLRSLLEKCEAPMLKAYKFKGSEQKTTVNHRGNSDDNDNESSQKAKSESDALNELGGTLPSSEGGTIKETRKTKQGVDQNAVLVFIETMFGKDKELERTDRLMQNMRVYNLRFDANCEEILSNILPFNVFEKSPI